MWTSTKAVYGIDLGTCRTLIYRGGSGIVLEEPSLVAIRTNTRQIEAFGNGALDMIGRTPADLEVIYPLQDGVIANFDLAAGMLRHFIGRLGGRFTWLRPPQVVIAVPCGLSGVQRRAAEETVLQRGAKKAMTVEEPLLAAIGAGLPVEEPIGSMIVDVGGGKSQAAVVSLGGIVVHRQVRGSMSVDREIMAYVKRTYNMAIGERTAEEIKKRSACFASGPSPAPIEVRGRDLVAGLPGTIRLRPEELQGLLGEFVFSLVEMIRVTLEQCPPELAGDIMEQGIALCGGGALLDGLDRRLQEELGVPVFLTASPERCVALGTEKFLP